MAIQTRRVATIEVNRPWLLYPKCIHFVYINGLDDHKKQGKTFLS